MDVELVPGRVAVVADRGSGIGLAPAGRFARGGLNVVLAEVDEPALAAASERVAALRGAGV
jgi:NAD(P)-dependent dehydrogenase (short-subunit alcohol dehydrogenase family)